MTKLENRIPKYRIEPNEWKGEKSWYVVRRPITVIAQCWTERDAKRIRNALTVFDSLDKEKQILSELLV